MNGFYTTQPKGTQFEAIYGHPIKEIGCLAQCLATLLTTRSSCASRRWVILGLGHFTLKLNVGHVHPETARRVLHPSKPTAGPPGRHPFGGD